MDPHSHSASAFIDETESANFVPDGGRFVCLHRQEDYRDDCLRGADTGDDFRTLVEAFMAAKRDGKVERKHNISDYP